MSKSKKTPIGYAVSKMMKRGVRTRSGERRPVSQKQALAIAFSIKRKGKLGPRGGYKK